MSTTTTSAAGTLKRPGRRADAARVATSAPDAYAEHLPALTRYCRRLVGDQQDAEDVAQDVMLKALAARPDPAMAAPWLFRVAHNTSVSLLRSRRRRAAEHLDDLPIAAPADVESTMAVRGRIAELLDDLAALPERQRQALLLRELDGCSAKAIARTLDITEAAAQQAVLDARRSLAHCAEGRALACNGVQRWLSDHDWTRLRTRRVRAHLRDCGSCTTFAERMGTRPADLRVLWPHGGLLELLAKIAAGGATTAKLAAGLAGVAVVAGTAGVAVEPRRDRAAAEAERRAAPLATAHTAAAVALVRPSEPSTAAARRRVPARARGTTAARPTRSAAVGVRDVRSTRPVPRRPTASAAAPAAPAPAPPAAERAAAHPTNGRQAAPRETPRPATTSAPALPAPEPQAEPAPATPVADAIGQVTDTAQHVTTAVTGTVDQTVGDVTQTVAGLTDRVTTGLLP